MCPSRPSVQQVVRQPYPPLPEQEPHEDAHSDAKDGHGEAQPGHGPSSVGGVEEGVGGGGGGGVGARSGERVGRGGGEVQAVAADVHHLGWKTEGISTENFTKLNSMELPLSSPAPPSISRGCAAC